MTASTITVKLSRGDNTSWGFRLQGGKDFSTPLSIQRVNPGSLADSAGLISGDGILKIGGRSTENLKHKEAQDCILRAGNNLEIVIQRGGMRIWKPTVTPVNDIPARTASPISTQTFTKTSLAANKQETAPIGSKHNVSPRPFANLGGGKLLVNNQYNTPVPLYSLNNIAETLSAHTEVLASGAKGINFMKEAQPVNTESAVYRMIMEENQRSEDFNHVDKKEPTAVTQHVSAPINKPVSYLPQREVDPNACVECGKSIIGVFVRIKGKSMHPDCFRCSTCGTSLKNVGYFSVNDKLYCDMHAKQAAKVTATTPTYEPCTLSQIGPSTDQTPAQVSPVSPTPQTPVSAPLSPIGFRSVSPTPFHKPLDIHHMETASSPQPLSSPPIFKSTAAPSFSTPTPTFKPTTIQNTAPVYPSSVQQLPSAGITTPHTGATGGSKFVWPPPKNPPTEQLILVSNTTPTPPSYRPPPETQHVTTSRSFKYQSSMSPPLPGGGTLFGSQKVPPPTCPKPHVPVQGTQRQQGQAAGSGHHTWTSTTSGISSTSVIGGGSGFMMSPGAGSRPAPRKGRGQLKAQVGAGSRIPICAICGSPIRGPFVTALGKTWCPEHFICANNRCQRALMDIGFIENDGALYCEICYEMHLAPICAKCTRKIKGDCLKALDKQWHPECFLCAHCHKPFGRSPFYMEDGKPYCEKDWNDLFTTKCVGCGYPIEAGDRWVEALNNNYHSQCFKCTVCHKNLENQSFYAVKGRPHCKAHAR